MNTPPIELLEYRAIIGSLGVLTGDGLLSRCSASMPAPGNVFIPPVRHRLIPDYSPIIDGVRL